MIAEEEYLKAKQIVQEYEKQLNISDVSCSKKLTNYIVSYTKDTTKTDVDVSIGSDNLDDLVKRLRSILSDSEFDSIWKIEIGAMSFG
jgi:hypothetical protein